MLVETPLLPEVAQDQDIAGHRTANNGELLAIFGPAEPSDVQARREMGHLMWSPTGQRLLPDVSGAIAGHGILQSVPVRRPVNCTGTRGRLERIKPRSPIGIHQSTEVTN